MTKYIPPSFDAPRVIEGLRKAMGFGEATRGPDKVTFRFTHPAFVGGPTDESGVPFDPDDRAPNERAGESKQVWCAVEYQDRAARAETFGAIVPARIAITLLDPDWQEVSDFSYVVIGGDTYWRTSVEPAIALGSIDVWTVYCAAEGES